MRGVLTLTIHVDDMKEIPRLGTQIVLDKDDPKLLWYASKKDGWVFLGRADSDEKAAFPIFTLSDVESVSEEDFYDR